MFPAQTNKTRIFSSLIKRLTIDQGAANGERNSTTRNNRIKQLKLYIGGALLFLCTAGATAAPLPCADERSLFVYVCGWVFIGLLSCITVLGTAAWWLITREPSSLLPLQREVSEHNGMAKRIEAAHRREKGA